jgi:hypothetical protein
MELNPLKLAAVAAVGGFLVFGGVSLAGAQESDDSTTTTTVVEDDDATTDDGSTGDRENCPHGDDSADAESDTDAGS